MKGRERGREEEEGKVEGRKERKEIIVRLFG